MSTEPLAHKNYGSIPHLPNSRMGPSDKSCDEGQARIATQKAGDSNDEIIVQEKLDGSNVGIAKVHGQIIPPTRAGYRAENFSLRATYAFAGWVLRPQNRNRFYECLRDGERLVGEWLMQAHGTRYNLRHEPFVAFDLTVESDRTPNDKIIARVKKFEFVTPHLAHRGSPVSVEDAMQIIGESGFHGAMDPVEGLFGG